MLVDRYPWCAAAMARALVAAGHEVAIQAPRVEVGALRAFGPEVVVCSVYRQPAAFGRPIRRFVEEVAGGASLLALQHHGCLDEPLALVVAHGLSDAELPRELAYDYFVGCRADPARCQPVVGAVCVRLLASLVPTEAAAAAPDPALPFVGVTICWGGARAG
jgi:hypothetical protein